jgi:hypothetical protein
MRYFTRPHHWCVSSPSACDGVLDSNVPNRAGWPAADTPPSVTTSPPMQAQCRNGARNTATTSAYRDLEKDTGGRCRCLPSGVPTATFLRMPRCWLRFQNLQSSGALLRFTRVLRRTARFRKQVRCEVRVVGRVQHCAASLCQCVGVGEARMASMASLRFEVPH